MRLEAFMAPTRLGPRVHTLDFLRLLLGGGFLAFAARLDWRTRRVPNRIWISLGTLASLLFLVDWLVTKRYDAWTVLIAAALVALAYVLWLGHLLAGGADAKAMMALGILLPRPIEWDILEAWPVWSSPLPGALVVLSNSVLLFALAPVFLFALNAVRGDLSFPAAFLGYRMPLDETQGRFVWIVDRVDETGRRSQVLFPSATSEAEYAANVERLRAQGILKVWVTPKIPFMVPLFAGFVTAFFLGDLLYRLVFAVITQI